LTNITTDGSTQSRGFNKQNQITAITGLNPTSYDANGNMTTDETGRTLVFEEIRGRESLTDSCCQWTPRRVTIVRARRWPT
jgi:hypothetical protein